MIYLPTLDLRKSHGIGLELRCAQKDGTVTVTDVLPPSIHELTHKPYVWAGLGDWRNLPELPEALLALWRELAKNGTKKAAGHSEGGPILEGDRNNHLTSLAGTMRRRGMSEAAIRGALMAENEERCVPPLSETEVAQIAKSVGRYAPGQDHQLPPVEVYVEDARKEGRGGNSDASHHDKHGEADTTGSADTGGAPTIQYEAGELPRNLDEAESALLIRGGVYQRDLCWFASPGSPNRG